MNHKENAIEIVIDAPITLQDFYNCYPHLSYERCCALLSRLAFDGAIKRCAFGVYSAVM